MERQSPFTKPLFAGLELLQPVTARMSSRYHGVNGHNFPATKCIDGDVEGPIEDGNLCNTQFGGLEKPERSPWIAIDYKSIVTVKKVEIFNREDCCGLWTRKVDVRVSNELPTTASEMFSGGSLLGHFAGPGRNGEHIIVTGYIVQYKHSCQSDQYSRSSLVWQICHCPDGQW